MDMGCEFSASAAEHIVRRTGKEEQDLVDLSNFYLGAAASLAGHISAYLEKNVGGAAAEHWLRSLGAAITSVARSKGTPLVVVVETQTPPAAIDDAPQAAPAPAERCRCAVPAGEKCKPCFDAVRDAIRTVLAPMLALSRSGPARNRPACHVCDRNNADAVMASVFSELAAGATPEEADMLMGFAVQVGQAKGISSMPLTHAAWKAATGREGA